MPASVRVYASQDYEHTANANSDLIIISDQKESFTSKFIDFASVSGVVEEADVNLLVSVAQSRLTSCDEISSSAELFVRGLTSADPPRRIVLALLPSKYGRHSAPSRSHSVASLVKSHRGSNRELVVILAPSSSDYFFPQALAVGRQFPIYCSKSSSTARKEKDLKVSVILKNSELSQKTADTMGNVIDGIRLAQRLVDSPPNDLHTDAYVEECRAVALRTGCKIQVIGAMELERLGFGGLYGVGKASEHLPALVILSHLDPNCIGEKSICLVGKGIVYDTGGLSIKTPTGMPGMKTDMGGSAAVLGAFEAAMKSGISGNYHALMCIAENSVGPLSTRPDDVHTFLSGKTVEVNNTDAEGRLVLADGCFYASDVLNPRIIIDIATLTGAQLIATGRKHAAIYCNDDDLESLAVKLGKSSGDLVHPIPYSPEFYKPEFKSDVADMKNSVADRQNAQASCAAQFIGNHIEGYLNSGGLWLHIDMAGPACVGERATGYGVALLYELLKYA